MNNGEKNISSVAKNAIEKCDELTETLKENTTNAVKDLLRETVMETYTKILNEEEEDEKEYDVEEVEDTDVEDANADDADENSEDEMDSEIEDDSEDKTEDDVEADDSAEDDVEADDETEDEDDDMDWSEFEKYKVGDEEYDFSNAEDDEVVKVYKWLKDDDQVVVTKGDDDKISIKDNETGAEYIIQLDDEEDDDNIVDSELNTDSEENDENEMTNEERLFEIALNEYDSNVGYTDNYQKKDAMTTDGVKEPGKNVTDWDAGVPKDSKKPWSGKQNDKKENQPFTGAKGKTIEEEDEVEMEEGKNVGGFVQQNSTSKSSVPNSNGRSARSASKGGERIKGTTTPRYAPTNEAIQKRVNAIYKENQELKKALTKFNDVLKEAAVVNVNLGNIIKLITENTTSVDEKKEIISRFGKEAKTKEESKKLYESITRELANKNKMTIEENVNNSESNRLNEKKLYMSEEMTASLDLMSRICK